MPIVVNYGEQVNIESKKLKQQIMVPVHWDTKLHSVSTQGVSVSLLPLEYNTRIWTDWIVGYN